MNVKKTPSLLLVGFLRQCVSLCTRVDEIDYKVYAIEDGMVHVLNDDFSDSIEVNTGENATHGLFYSEKEYSRFIFRFQFLKMSLLPKGEPLCALVVFFQST